MNDRRKWVPVILMTIIALALLFLGCWGLWDNMQWGNISLPGNITYIIEILLAALISVGLFELIERK